MTDKTTRISVLLPTAMIDQADVLASAIQQDRDWVIRHALERYLEEESDDLKEAAAGLRELNEGHSKDLDDVLKAATDIIDRAESRKARRHA